MTWVGVGMTGVSMGMAVDGCGNDGGWVRVSLTWLAVGGKIRGRGVWSGGAL